MCVVEAGKGLVYRLHIISTKHSQEQSSSGNLDPEREGSRQSIDGDIPRQG